MENRSRKMKKNSYSKPDFELYKYLSISVKDFLDERIESDELNRLVDQDWVNQIVEKQIEYKEKYGTYSYNENLKLIYHQEKKELRIIDGQHRIQSLKKLATNPKYSDILNYVICIYIIPVEDDKHANFIFQLANTRLIENSSVRMEQSDENYEPSSDKIKNELDFKIKIREICDKLEKKYPGLFLSNTKSNAKAPRINREQFIINMREVENINDIDSDAIFKKLCMKNEKCKKFMIDSKDQSMLKRVRSVAKEGNGFYLSYYHFYMASTKENITGSKYGNCKWVHLIKFY